MNTINRGISILGCGWYGLPLAKLLLKNGFSVKGSTTTADKIPVLKEAGIIPYLINFDEDQEIFDADFFINDTLIICIPPKRSTAEQHTFFTKIEKIAKAATEAQLARILFISSTSVYGDHNREVNELTQPRPDTASGKAILGAENLLRGSKDYSTTILRFGGLIGPDRAPGRFFAGKTNIANGQAPVNLIHLTDCLGITCAILEADAFGYIFNACSPEHPSRAAFYTQAAVNSGYEKPEFADELLNWKIVDSMSLPHNYTFKVPLNSIVTQ
jgi:nucleoside-diphosphate-sugar epimerase